MCGDSTKPEDVKKLMNGIQADLLITDPPYNVDYSSKDFGRTKMSKSLKKIEKVTRKSSLLFCVKGGDVTCNG